MNFPLLFAQNNPIPSHAIVALIAIIAGAWQLYSKKGGSAHRYLGYLWVSLMMYVSISSFWIHTLKVFGNFSPIHLLSIFTIWTLYEAIRAARNHNLLKHKRMMKLLYVLGLVITGLFTLLPNRTMYEVLFN
jgi:uncharacterized membrane protein